jgi:hypothetical protein
MKIYLIQGMMHARVIFAESEAEAIEKATASIDKRDRYAKYYHPTAIEVPIPDGHMLVKIKESTTTNSVNTAPGAGWKIWVEQ